MGKFFFLLCDCSRRPEQNAEFYHIVGARCSTRSLDAAAGLMESIQTFIKVVPSNEEFSFFVGGCKFVRKAF